MRADVSRRVVGCGFLFGMLLAPAPAAAQLLSEWHFDSNLTAFAGQGTMSYFDTPTQTGTAFGTTTSFGIPAIGAAVRPRQAGRQGMDVDR